MRLFGRTFFYSFGLCAVLVYLSFRIYSSPGQVKLRVEAFLREVLAAEVRVERCEEPFLGVLRIGTVVVPASPALDERALAAVEDIRVNDPSARRPFRRLLGEPAEETGAPRSIRAARASLFLDHAAAGPAGLDGERWNFADFMRTGAVPGLLESARAEVLIDRLEVQVQDIRGPRQKSRLRFVARDVEARAQAPSRLSMEADLDEGEHWSGGHVKAVWLLDGGIEVHGEVSEVRNAEAWLPLLGGRIRALWETLRPSGTWDVELEEARFVPGREARWRAVVRHYDTALRVGPSAVEFRHLSGPARVTEESIAFGDGAGEAKPTAEVFGIPIELSGVAAAARMDLKLRLPPAALDGLFVGKGEGRAAGAFVEAWAGLRPQGGVEGEATWAWAAPEPEKLQGEIRLRDLSFAGLGLLARGSAVVSFETGSPAGDASPAKGLGSGKAAADLPCAGLGILRGKAEFSWDQGGVEMKLFDFAVAAAAATDGPAGPGSGSLFGTVRAGWDLAVRHVDLRWLEIPLGTGLFRARDSGGTLGMAAPLERALGLGHLSDVVVPAGALTPDLGELSFTAGKWLIDVARQGIQVRSFKLGGTERSLRARGTVSFRGELDCVVLLGEGPTHRALFDLPEESGPFAWKEAARGSYRAFRVTGTLSAPRSREIGGFDPAFVEEE